MSVVSAVDCIFSFTIVQRASQMKRSKLPYSKNRNLVQHWDSTSFPTSLYTLNMWKSETPFRTKPKIIKLKKANRVRFSFSGLWSPYLIFLGQTIIFTLSLVTKILVGYKSYLQKCLFLISRVIWWARWGGRGRGGRGWVCEGGGGKRITGLGYLKFIGVHWVSFEF